MRASQVMYSAENKIENKRRLKNLIACLLPKCQRWFVFMLRRLFAGSGDGWRWQLLTSCGLNNKTSKLFASR